MSLVPSFVIVGAQKAGTTAAARNLSMHPRINVYSGTTEYGQKELEYFNQHWERGDRWYASHFSDATKVNGEKTAELLHRTLCHERMYSTNPTFKIVVLLRAPVERAFSQWKMARFIKGDETVDFDAAIERELRFLDSQAYRDSFYRCSNSGVTCWREGYVLKGMYDEQLDSLFSRFARQQILVVVSEQIRANPVLVYEQLFSFLGVEAFADAFRDHFAGPPAAPMSTRARSLLTQVYEGSLERLYRLLGTAIPEWS